VRTATKLADGIGHNPRPVLLGADEAGRQVVQNVHARPLDQPHRQVAVARPSDKARERARRRRRGTGGAPFREFRELLHEDSSVRRGAGDAYHGRVLRGKAA
jgi:hypothetical protein